MLKVKKYKDLKKLDSKQIYCLLRNFEISVKESFLDYNADFINNANLLFYLHGKGVISTSEINICIDKGILVKGSLNELFEEFEIIYLYRLKFISDISVNFDIFLKRLFKVYKAYKLEFQISKSLFEKVNPELKILY